MHILLTYDVTTTTPEGQRRLRQVAKLCEGYGQRVQQSVFEIVTDQAGLLTLLDDIARTIADDEDNIRVYRLPAEGFSNVQTLGKTGLIPHNDPLIM
jgi:CRISPR-associated protein Cas2